MLNIKDRELVSLKEIVDIAAQILANPQDYQIEHVETNVGSTNSSFTRDETYLNKIGFNLVYLDKTKIGGPKVTNE